MIALFVGGPLNGTRCTLNRRGMVVGGSYFIPTGLVTGDDAAEPYVLVERSMGIKVRFRMGPYHHHSDMPERVVMWHESIAPILIAPPPTR